MKFRSQNIFGFVLVLLVCLSLGCKQKVEMASGVPDAPTLSSQVKMLSAEIAEDNYIGTEQTGRREGMDPAFARRLKLMRIATDAELLILSGDTNAVVGLTAFEGLYKRGNESVPAIFTGFMKRDDIIQYLRGDIAMQMPMLEYAYVYIMHFKIPNEPMPPEVEKAEPKFELPEEKHEQTLLNIAGLRAQKINPKY